MIIIIDSKNYIFNSNKAESRHDMQISPRVETISFKDNLTRESMLRLSHKTFTYCQHNNLLTWRVTTLTSVWLIMFQALYAKCVVCVWSPGSKSPDLIEYKIQYLLFSFYIHWISWLKTEDLKTMKSTKDLLIIEVCRNAWHPIKTIQWRRNFP